MNIVGAKTIQRRIFQIVNYILLSGVAVACLLPVWHVLCASVSDPLYVMSKTGLVLWPKGFTLEGYDKVFAYQELLRSYGNTFFYVFSATALGLAATTMGAYAVSRRNVLWSNVIMMIITFTMLFSGGIIPFYILIRDLGLYNSRWAIILPMCVSAFNFIIMRTAMASVPASLEESAKLDGANHITIFVKIIMPLVKPTVATITLYYAVFHWNAWFNASIFLRNRELFPLQLILKEILIANDLSNINTITSAEAADTVNLFRELIKYCVIIVSTVPIFCFYPFVQKYFESGVMIGAIKG